jgi:hypothetical protein
MKNPTFIVGKIAVDESISDGLYVPLPPAHKNNRARAGAIEETAAFTQHAREFL